MPISPPVHAAIHHAVHNLPWYKAVCTWFLTTTVDKWEKFIQIVAIIAGGIAAYYRFFKGRVYRGRLELSVTGTAVERNEFTCVIVTATIKNIGATKLDIKKEATAFELYSLEDYESVKEPISADWEFKGTFSVFQDDDFIEAGESSSDQYLVIMPQDNERFYKAEFAIRAGKAYWIARTIFPVTNEDQQQGTLREAEGGESIDKRAAGQHDIASERSKGRSRRARGTH